LIESNCTISILFETDTVALVSIDIESDIDELELDELELDELLELADELELELSDELKLSDELPDELPDELELGSLFTAKFVSREVEVVTINVLCGNF